MKLSQVRRASYRFGATLGDIQAGRRGPGSLARRAVRRRAYATSGRGTRAVLRALGMSR